MTLENRAALPDDAVTDSNPNIEGLNELKYWVNHERFPSVVEITAGNFHQVMKTNKFIVLAVLEADKVGRLTKNMIEYYIIELESYFNSKLSPLYFRYREILATFSYENRHLYHE